MIVIGDVHGCYKTLRALLDKIPDEHKDRVCFAGDLIDRGPRSREVVQFVMDNGYDCVQGNHEQMMVHFYEGHDPWNWIGQGGRETEDSYYDADEDLPEEHRMKHNMYLNKEVLQKHLDWIDKLPVAIEYKDCKTPDGRHLVVSHSICHNYWKMLNGEDEERVKLATTMIAWNRNFGNLKDKGFYNVIGHTPQMNGPKITKVYANVDTGAFCGHGRFQKWKEKKLGYLTALHVPTMTIYQQECIDD